MNQALLISHEVVTICFTHTHANTNTHIHTQHKYSTHTGGRKQIHWRPRLLPANTYTHTHTHTHTHIHKTQQTQIHTATRVQKSTHASRTTFLVLIHTHQQTYSHTHPRHTHTRTHVHNTHIFYIKITIQTHTHTPPHTHNHAFWNIFFLKNSRKFTKNLSLSQSRRTLKMQLLSKLELPKSFYAHVHNICLSKTMISHIWHLFSAHICSPAPTHPPYTHTHTHNWWNNIFWIHYSNKLVRQVNSANTSTHYAHTRGQPPTKHHDDKTHVHVLNGCVSSVEILRLSPS